MTSYHRHMFHYDSDIFHLHGFDTVSWATGRATGPEITACWFVGVDIFDWSFARLIAPVVTTSSITLCSNKMKNGDILVPANSGPPGNSSQNGERLDRHIVSADDSMSTDHVPN